MYRAYADDPQARINLGIRRRLAPLLGNDRRVIELVNALLLSLPGTPVIYYGDELGMGDNIYLGDRNGVRTPMQWSPDRNARLLAGEPAAALPARRHRPGVHGAVNVESQQANPNSLLWWMKRLIALRKRYQAFGRGTLEFLLPENRKVLAFLREYGEERILVVVQPVAARAVRRARPAPLRGPDPRGAARPQPVPGHRRAALPARARPARLLLVRRCTRRRRDAGGPPGPSPEIRVRGPLAGRSSSARRAASSTTPWPAFLPSRRWFAGKSRGIRRVVLDDARAHPRPGPGARPATCASCGSSTARASPTPTCCRWWRARRASTAARPRPSTVAMLDTQDGRLALLDGARRPRAGARRCSQHRCGAGAGSAGRSGRSPPAAPASCAGSSATATSLEPHAARRRAVQQLGRVRPAGWC